MKTTSDSRCVGDGLVNSKNGGRGYSGQRSIVQGLLLVVFAVNAGGLRAYAGTPVLVGKVVSGAQAKSMQSIDHAAWDALLRKFVDAKGMVDYRAWKADAVAVKQLEAYLDHLSEAQLDSSTPAAVQLAYWINAYNAVTVKGILREYPTASIRNHTAKFLGYNIWKDLKLQVGGKQVSLDSMEHEILRKMREPRIHFAIVCASISCPKLQAWAYAPEKLDAQLTQSAMEFFRDPSRNRYEVGRSKVQLSQIMSWFAADFGADRNRQLKFIAQYAPEEARNLLASGRASISYLKYDWGLNEKK